MPDPSAYVFDQRGAQRIVATVKTVENVGSLEAMQALGGMRGGMILAKLTSRDTTDPRLYAWSQYRAGSNSVELMPGGLAGTVGSHPVAPAIDAIGGTSGANLTDAYTLLVPTVYHRGSVQNFPCFQIVGGGGGALPFPRPIYCPLMPINTSGDLAFDAPRFT